MALRRLAAAVLVAAACGERHAIRPSPPARRRALSSMVALLASAGVASSAGSKEAILDFVQPDVKEKFAELDKNGDGVLDSDEYAVMAREQAESADEDVMRRVSDQYQRLFEAADVDGDGRLNPRELEYLFTLRQYSMLTELRAGLLQNFATDEAKHEVEAALQAEKEDPFGTAQFQWQVVQSDTNGNGKIEKEEYEKAMRQTATDAWFLGPYLDDPNFSEWLDKLWVFVDISGDGFLNAKEVQYTAFISDTVFRSGLFTPLVIAGSLLSELDINKDGKVTRQEVEVMRSGLVDSAPDVAQVAQKAELPVEDMRQGLQDANTVLDRLSETWSDFDVDGDDELDKGELADLVRTMLDSFS